MNRVDIIVPVKNEEQSVSELVRRIDKTLVGKYEYRIVFVDDNSTDDTVAEIKRASRSFPIKLLTKKGKPGKGYSILEGATYSDSEFVVMIDGDLQYPPEALAELIDQTSKYDVVVANRKTINTKRTRRFVSSVSKFVVGRLISGMKLDTQSGMKIFRRNLVQYIKESEISGWGFDVPLLATARDLGYSIGTIDLDFVGRKNGESKIRFVRATAEITLTALRRRMQLRKVYTVKPKGRSKIGGGYVYKGKHFVTHNDLPLDKSALKTAYGWQIALLLSVIGLIFYGVFQNAWLTSLIIVAILSLIYFVDFLFGMVVLHKSLKSSNEIKIDAKEIESIDTTKLPMYTVLSPLYKEANVLEAFVDSMNALDWPKEKLEVLLLLEENDTDTINKARSLNLPSHFRIVVVPDSQPKTKPKACNYGLALAKGEYVVIYDAEDRPDPLQLKKSYLAFKRLGSKVFCLQSKLNYYNTDQNLLTRLFTAEYSLWFDLILPGLQSIGASIPLGGTSNHFRRTDLRKLSGWDPFNVTEDCDLGVRIFKLGYKTAIVDSVTLEEANSKVGNWIRQRSRWIKGYLQTYLVHMRSPVKFARQHKHQFLIFQLVIGLRIVFLLINPILWVVTVSYFVAYGVVGEAIESVYPTPILYMSVLTLIFGNFLYMYNYMVASAKRGSYTVVKFVYLIPFYWLLGSVAAYYALWQLVFKPHYWEKTLHGLHLAPTEKVSRNRNWTKGFTLPRPNWSTNPVTLGGGVLVVTSLVISVINFVYNIYLGRSLSLEAFGTISLFTSIFALFGIVTTSIGRTVNYKSAYELGRTGTIAINIWKRTRSNMWILGLVLTLVWLVATPTIAEFFNSDTLLPFIIFAPTWLSVVLATDWGFLNGSHKFIRLSIVYAIETFVRFVSTVVLIELGYTNLVYVALPLSIVVPLFFALFIIKPLENKNPKKSKRIEFPSNFLGWSILMNIAFTAFLSMDIIFAKHFLTPSEAGEYALLSVLGKTVYFLGSLAINFITPLVSKLEGQGKSANVTFYKLLTATTAISIFGFVVLGLFGDQLVELVIGENALGVSKYLLIYSYAMAAFTISCAFITYHQVKKQNVFVVVGLGITIFMSITMGYFARSLADFTAIITVFALVELIIVILFHATYGSMSVIANNVKDFFGLFEGEKSSEAISDSSVYNILVLNWRDTKHIWAGGAEVYIHEIAKRWIADGHSVTMFCGNDGQSSRNQTVDRVHVIRRGGFYMVYFWAMLYYVFKFRGKFDVIVDCENGIPFFSTFYSRIPKILVVHHVHGEVFREHLRFPFKQLAMFLEAYLMPLVYRNTPVITASQSSKDDLELIGVGRSANIQIASPGVDNSYFVRKSEDINPLIVYVGRLAPYKNLDIAMKAFAQVSQEHTKSRFVIAGFGEELDNLRKLRDELGLRGRVKFLGSVSEKYKRILLSKAWMCVQPSSMEGWGMTVVEANAAGTPVVASDTKGLRDSVVDGRTGILVPVCDVDAFAKSMDQLIKNPRLRNNLSQEAVRWARRFEWHSLAANFLQTISDEIDRKNAFSWGLPELLKRKI